jgi:hypothetical protein
LESVERSVVGVEAGLHNDHDDLQRGREIGTTVDIYK